MSKFYSLLPFFILAVLSSKTNAQTDSCTANFEKIISTNVTSLTASFHALPWNNNQKKPEQICWNFGDTHDTCIQYDPSLTGDYLITHRYTQTGVYNVCIKILYQGGCQSYACKSVQIGAADSCGAGFDTRVSTSNPVGEYFIAHPWHGNNKKPVYICWNFGDNRDTCIQYSTSYTGSYAVYHLYPHTDNYNVCVKIQYDGGCVSQYCGTVHVGESPDSCLANFEGSSVSSTPLSRHFVAQPWNNHNKKPVSICWNFGDNHDTCIQYSNTNSSPYTVDHTYTMPGQYEVCIRIVYDGGCVSEKCNSLQVDELDSCYADFEKIPTTPVNNPSFVYYRALPKNNHEKKPARICWSFGDGTDSCISYSEDYTGYYYAGHHYNHSGIYEVCVSIYYYGGCETKKCKNIEIPLYNTDTCRVYLYEAIPSITSLTREFYFVSSNTNRPARVCWSFGDGIDTCVTVVATATGIPYSIRHIYPAPGIYRACVKVLFHNGCVADNCIEANIRSLTDICGGYYIDSLVDLHRYFFKAFAIHKQDDAVISYRWTFGDGSSGVGEKISHTYQEAGIYRVCLLINTEKGCETRICNEIGSSGTTQSRLQLSPNPVVDVLHVLFYSSHNEIVTIKIFDSNGVVVRSYTRTEVLGPNRWNFETTGLLPGIYSLSVQSPDQFASAIFIKQ